MSIDLKFKRKLMRLSGSRGVLIPPILLENMGATECENVIVSAPDNDHILIEVVRHA